MVIDKILDRRDGCEYNAGDFYTEMLAYEKNDMTLGVSISSAMDYGTEQDVKEALCKYIDRGGYNGQLKEYINSVIWVQKHI